MAANLLKPNGGGVLKPAVASSRSTRSRMKWLLSGRIELKSPLRSRAGGAPSF